MLAVELLPDLREHVHLSETPEEKLKRFVVIFVYGMYNLVVYVLIFYIWLSRSNHQRSSVKKGVLENFSIFTDKHLCWSPFLPKRDPSQVFSCEYCKILKNTYIEKHLRTVSSDCQKMINNILQLLNEQPATGIHNASMKIENSCHI